MIAPFKSSFRYTANIVEGWDNTSIGVYYCGYPLENGNFIPLYIGKGTGDGGMRSRLLDHLRDDYWPDATHFGYHICDFANEADQHEAKEIAKYKPKYNTVGK